MSFLDFLFPVLFPLELIIKIIAIIVIGLVTVLGAVFIPRGKIIVIIGGIIAILVIWFIDLGI